MSSSSDETTAAAADYGIRKYVHSSSSRVTCRNNPWRIYCIFQGSRSLNFMALKNSTIHIFLGLLNSPELFCTFISMWLNLESAVFRLFSPLILLSFWLPAFLEGGGGTWSKLKQSCFYFPPEQTMRVAHSADLRPGKHSGFYHVIKSPFPFPCLPLLHWSIKVTRLGWIKVRSIFLLVSGKSSPSDHPAKPIKNMSVLVIRYLADMILPTTAQRFPQQDPCLWFVWELCPSLPLLWLMLMGLKSITCK